LAVVAPARFEVLRHAAGIEVKTMVAISVSKNEAKWLSQWLTDERTMSSAGFSGPIEVWFWATAIDMAVKEFADENGLECALRPHGEHIWYVRKSAEPEPDFFQQVQVAAFHRDGDESAILTPFAYV
jgi:hypothetical protein